MDLQTLILSVFPGTLLRQIKYKKWWNTSWVVFNSYEGEVVIEWFAIWTY